MRSSNDLGEPPRSLLTPVWGGSGRGGTAPYPHDGGSRPVSPSDGWMVDPQDGGVGSAGGAGGAGGRRGDTSGTEGGEAGIVGRISFSGGSGVGGRGGEPVLAAAEGAPPGAHRAMVRAATGGVVVDPGLILAASGVRTGAAVSGDI